MARMAARFFQGVDTMTKRDKWGGRRELRELEGKRLRFRATFERLGKRRNWHGFDEPTILLRDVYAVDDNALVTDHLWFKMLKGFEALGALERGDDSGKDGRNLAK